MKVSDGDSLRLNRIPSQINKGVAMHIFCQWLNVDVKGVMSFGDGDNDCEVSGDCLNSFLLIQLLT